MDKFFRQRRDNFLMSRPKNIFLIIRAFNLKKRIVIIIIAAGANPILFWNESWHIDFFAANSNHFFANNLSDFLDGLKPKRQKRVNTSRFFIYIPCPLQKLGRDRLLIGGRLTACLGEELSVFHSLTLLEANSKVKGQNRSASGASPTCRHRKHRFVQQTLFEIFLS